MNDTKQQTLWQSHSFRAYIASTACSGMGLAMQQLLLSWMLVGILLLPADQVGLIQAFIGLPGVLLMLIGGASADRSDPRNVLIVLYLLAPIFPLFLIGAEQTGQFAVWSVVSWGLGIGVVSAYTMPAQQALLNRVSGHQVQQSVTVATVAGFVVQVIGLLLAGQMDVIGITPILATQSVMFVLASLTLRRIPVQASPQISDKPSALHEIWRGLQAIYQHKVIYDVLIINFISTIFNAGSFMTVFPYIVKRVYDGDALVLGGLMAVFFAGGALSNLVLLRFMPLRHPGRVYLLMQLTRIIVLVLMWIQPSWWLLVLAVIGWGVNMGVTSNLARALVQESAPAEYRGRILSVFSLTLIGSAPLGAVVLGVIIEQFGTLNALLPAMLTSLVLFGYGIWFTGIWSYRSE